MASFTDIQPQFTPYVHQLPIDAMVKVGMEKQQRYDEGVQKIQQGIDNIGGLDITKPADQAYLQSKLNQLGNNLKTVAAGDFSNFQLVNSVSGMTNQIIKDKNIQNAVYSTANHRKQTAAMEEAKAKGELAPENVSDYNKAFDAYYNSNKPGEMFNGQYTPYINVSKKLFEIGKEVGLDETTTQQLFETDNNGNFIYEKNAKGENIGPPKFNAIMVEKHLKGKDVGKILNTFKAALTPADYNQLAITGRYVNAGLSKEDLAKTVSYRYDQDILKTNGKLQGIKLELDKENSKNNKDQAKIDTLTKQKEFFETHDADLKKSLADDLSRVESNPDAVRASMYTNGYLTTIATGIGGITEETKYSVNPMFTINMEEQKFQREKNRDMVSDARWAADQENKKLELFLKYGVGTPPPGFKGPGGDGLNEPINVETNAHALVSSVRDDYSAGVADLNNTNYGITLEYFKRVNPIKDGEKPAAYENRLKKAISAYATANKESIDPQSGGINTFTARFANKQLAEWKKDPNSVPMEMKGLMNQQNELVKVLNNQQTQINDTRNQAVEQARKEGIDVSTYTQLEKTLKPVTIQLRDGSSTTLSKSDIIDFANLHPEEYNFFRSWSVDKNQEELINQSRKRLELKYGKDKLGKLEAKLYQIVPTKNEFGGESQVSMGIHPVIKSTGEQILKSNYGKISQIEAQLYLDKGYIKQPKSFIVMKGKENTQDFNARIAAITSKYNLDPAVADQITQAVLTGDSKLVKVIATPGISSRQPITYSMRVTTKTGVQDLAISADDFPYLTGHAPLQNTPEPLVVSQLNSYGTTGHEGSDAPDAAWFSASDFKNMKSANYTVTGNLVADKANPNNLWFKMFVHTKDGRIIPLTYTEPIPKFNPDGSINQALDIIPQGIFPTTIEQLMHSK